MKQSEYYLFPQQNSTQKSNFQQEKLFSPQQNWRQVSSHQMKIEQVQTQPTSFQNQYPVLTPTNRIAPQPPIQFILPTQRQGTVITTQVPQRVSVQPYIQQQQIWVQQQQHQEEKKESPQQQILQEAQQTQQVQQQQTNPIHIYKQQLIQDMVQSQKVTDKQKELEQKIHQEILSQSKRVNPSVRQGEPTLSESKSKNLLQSINIHDNSKELHLQKSKVNRIFEDSNIKQQQPVYLQQQLSSVQLQSPYVSYVSPLYTSQTRLVPPQPIQLQNQSLITSQVRIIQPMTTSATTTVLPAKASQVFISNIAAKPVTQLSRVISSPPQVFNQTASTRLLTQPTIVTKPVVTQTSTLPAYRNLQQNLNTLRVSQIIQSPKNSISANQQQFRLSNGFVVAGGFQPAQTDREQQRNLIKTIDGGIVTERVTRTNKTEPDLNVHQQQVRDIIQQSKYLLQNDILPQNEELNKQYYGLKEYEKLSLQNRIELDNKFKEFERRRMVFNQKLQQYSSIPQNNSSYIEYSSPQSDLYLIQQQRSQQVYPQSVQITQNNVQVLNKHQQQQNPSVISVIQTNNSNSYGLAPKNENVHSQTLKQPILNEYEQSLIHQQYSTSSFPTSSRQQYQQQLPTQNENLNSNPININEYNQNEKQQQINEEYRNEFDKVYNEEQNENYIRKEKEDRLEQEYELYNNKQVQDEEDENDEFEQAEPSIANQIYQQQISTSAVHKVIEGDEIYSQQHQEFKMKFQKSKNQFYSEKSSQLSERSKQQQQQEQEQQQNEILQSQQQYLAVRGQANQQIQEQVIPSNKQQLNTVITTTVKTVTEKITKNDSQESQEENQQKNNLQQIDLAIAQQQNLQSRNQVNQLFLQSLENKYQEQFDEGEEGQLVQDEEQQKREIQQSQQQYLASRGQANQQIQEQVSLHSNQQALNTITTTTVKTVTETITKKDSSQNQEEQQQQQQINLNQTDLVNAQQQYLQGRSQVNQLFLQSLENKYQGQFEEEEQEVQQDQEEDEELQKREILQSQQQQLAAKGQSNQQVQEQVIIPNSNQSQNTYTTTTVKTVTETITKNDSQLNQEEHQQQININQTDLANAQQQYLQGRSQVNQLFLQSLENKYQEQFDEGEGEEEEQEQDEEQIKREILLSQQQYLASRGQANQQVQEQVIIPNSNQSQNTYTTTTVKTVTETITKKDSQKNQEDHQQQINLNQTDLVNAQQQYLQGRSQVNQLFLQSLENKYQDQFEEGEGEEEGQQHEYEENQYVEQNQNEQFEHQYLQPSQFASEEEYHRYLEQQQFLLMQQQYQQARGQANEQLMHAIYQNQFQTTTASSNTNQQNRGEELVNFEDLQDNQDQEMNSADINNEFEQQHNIHVNQRLLQQQYQQQILNQQHLNQMNSQEYHEHLSQSYYQQGGSPSNYDDEERLVMLRQQQLIAEKRMREEQQQKQIEQFEQKELVRLSNHNLGGNKNSLNPSQD